MLLNNLCKFWCCSKFHHTYVNNLQILYFEAHCRIQGPIYGCAGIIFKLYEQINSAEIALAYIDIQTQTACHKLQAESNFDVLPAQSSITAKFQWKSKLFGLIKITISNWYKAFDLYVLWWWAIFKTSVALGVFFFLSFFEKHRIMLEEFNASKCLLNTK